jgi:hypothetical protein
MDLRWAAHKRGLPLSLRERVPEGRVRERRWANVRLANSVWNSIALLECSLPNNGVSLIRPAGTFSSREKGVLEAYLRLRIGEKPLKTALQVFLFALRVPAMRAKVIGNAREIRFYS